MNEGSDQKMRGLKMDVLGVCMCGGSVKINSKHYSFHNANSQTGNMTLKLMVISM